MKKKVQMLVGLTLIGSSSFAQVKDSLRLVRLQEVQVVGTRATAKTPVAFSNVSKDQIKKQNFGQDIPFLLTMTPSVVATSDAGAGVGYTGIRVRGTDASRINVTANGVPLNDAESHTLYWVDMPDFASSIEDLQIQRGAGTSTNGAGAFGASINMKTESISALPYAEINGSYGSFNTHKETFKVGTGLLKSRWAFDARLSNLASDGYIDRASTDLKSFFAQAGYYGDNDIFKFIVFGGKEKTYHAWNGNEDLAGKGRRYNPCGEIQDADGNVIGFYKDQTDNYTQTNYQMLYTHIFSPKWNMNLTLHYTDGEGYYQEYKNKRSLEEYGLQPFVYYGKLIDKSDLVRQKRMDNGFGGGVFSFNYSSGRLQASLGGAANEYKGNNYGRVIWVKNYFNTVLDPDHEYYRNKSDKTDANIYLKASYELVKGLSAYGDLQYRYIHYTIDGLNDKWDWTKTPGGMQTLAVDNNYNFFNPKAGLFWQMNKNNSAYASFSVAHKEPTRNNFTDAKFGKTPSSERLFDYEAGYTYNDSRFLIGVNFYYMKYKDQLILTGQTNDIGEPLADNVPDSYRVGMEYMLGAKITSWLRWDGNATLCQNKINDYTEYLDNYDADWNPLYTQTSNYVGKTTIAYSPSVIANSMFTFTYKNWDAALQSSYVGKQYLSNSQQEDCVLHAYFVNNLRLGYTFSLPAFKSIHLALSINNLFNEKYESNGYGYSSYVIDSNGSKTRYNGAGYFAQAGTNILAGITLKF